jgi:hypothetical protein
VDAGHWQDPDCPNALDQSLVAHEAIFYSYTYPVPEGFAEEPVQPDAGIYSKDMGEFILPYDAIRQSPTPDVDLLAFFQSTYEAATNRANWDRAALEWDGPDRS